MRITSEQKQRLLFLKTKNRDPVIEEARRKSLFPTQHASGRRLLPIRWGAVIKWCSCMGTGSVAFERRTCLALDAGLNACANTRSRLYGIPGK